MSASLLLLLQLAFDVVVPRLGEAVQPHGQRERQHGIIMVRLAVRLASDAPVRAFCLSWKARSSLVSTSPQGQVRLRSDASPLQERLEPLCHVRLLHRYAPGPPDCAPGIDDSR